MKDFDLLKKAVKENFGIDAAVTSYDSVDSGVKCEFEFKGKLVTVAISERIGHFAQQDEMDFVTGINAEDVCEQIKAKMEYLDKPAVWPTFEQLG